MPVTNTDNTCEQQSCKKGEEFTVKIRGREEGEEERTVWEEFDEMPVSANLLRGIYGNGFERPSPIQKRAVVPVLRGGDVLAQAQSGTGKTAAFGIGVLGRMDFGEGSLQGLVLEPTRELAQQTADVVAALGRYLAGGEFVGVFVGGTRVAADVEGLKAGTPLIAVGTPGRVLDLFRRRALVGTQVKVLILDEADEMLSQGFEEQVREVFAFVPREVQVGLFSATLPSEVVALGRQFLRSPTEVLVARGPSGLALDGIAQFYVAVEENYKLETLMDLYSSVAIAQSIIFCRSRNRVEEVARKMNEQDFTVSCIHAELGREGRELALKAFRTGSARVLISTDLLTRGIDVQQVSIVVNYDLPSRPEPYLHRIGRCGRYGRKGVAINFVSPQATPTFRTIRDHYKAPIQELPLDFAEHLV
eukprot:TRINITY_DN5291_c0_g1_i1.p2 TRINITY_DN5291_c0_g1~~TRINITY_DN5291_c0_g1_i1.p2  ORF type:complete len:418 (+),score=136.65 TRINITY_DN5291_c0_g1_i1:92-1345(+)